MKKVYALVRTGGSFTEFKDNILLFESEESRDKKLETIIADLKSKGWRINNNYDDHTHYQCRPANNIADMMKYSSFTWSKVTLAVEED